jgi:methyl-accepting chemotaxis protein/methyl-accepting chemotaxis protein-1 (serine sensor receptor)
MGFAVVADEVRNLAQRCAQAAKDTAGLIEDSITRSGEGSSRLNEVAESIRSITESSGKAKELVEEINVGSQEQSRGIEQVARAVSQMEQVTQKTAANAEESASAGEELSAQSEGLRRIVERLSAMVGAAVAASRTQRVEAPKYTVKPKLALVAPAAAPKAVIPLEGDGFQAF